ncbi:Crp/Fnr family transcriptional regulator [Listeria costaricensis]|uniref:Crp/Fnr family transcriptional regulator n=1 Tax=Listeria costaricensis TaxID=2026604 RepID=UPI000C07B124|nr:Crp/Fnr family transcriptional regulator [Listeria costaricensis]
MEKLIEILTSNPFLKKRFTKVKSWKKREILYSTKNDIDEGIIYLITKGELKIEVFRHNVWLPLTILKCNDFIGIEHFIPHHEKIFFFDYRVIALSDGEGIQIEHEYFMDHIYADPRFLTILLQRVSMKYLFLLQHLFFPDDSLEKKIARTLWEFASFEGLENQAFIESTQYRAPSYVTKRLLSEYLQVSPYKINKVFLQWLEQGIMLSIKPIIINREKVRKTYFMKE